jgi:hypothetical protein
MAEGQIAMTEQQARTAAPLQISRFLDQGRDVSQGHLRNALALALKLIAQLQTDVDELKNRTR